MGQFRITITGVGGHGVEQEKKNGEIVNFESTPNSPDAIAKRFVEELTKAGNSLSEATIHHWPGGDSQVLDNLLTGKRVGNF